MTDDREIEIARAIREGELAQALLDNEVLQDILDEMETEFIEAWRTSSLDAPQDREAAFLAIRHHDTFKARIGARVEGAEYARAQRERTTARKLAAS